MCVYIVAMYYFKKEKRVDASESERRRQEDDLRTCQACTINGEIYHFQQQPHLTLTLLLGN